MDLALKLINMFLALLRIFRQKLGVWSYYCQVGLIDFPIPKALPSHNFTSFLTTRPCMDEIRKK